MENSGSTLKQLKVIKWLVVCIAVGIFVVAISIAYFSFSMSNIAQSSFADSSCNDESFRDKVSGLVDKGKTDDAFKLANERIKSHPNDENGYWYRGKAYYLQKQWQPAIDDFNKTEELAPSWKEEYTEPFRLAAQAKLAKH